MSIPSIEEFEDIFDISTKIYKVYLILKDKEWHCRECEYNHIGITQIASGSGIQGLQRGSAKRAGMEINSANHLCTTCRHTTRQDRWIGNFSESFTSISMLLEDAGKGYSSRSHSRALPEAFSRNME